MQKIHKVQNINFFGNRMKIKVDGSEFSVDLNKVSKRLLRASQKDRENYKVSPAGYGIHWPSIDEDLSIDALLGIRHNSPVKLVST